jgi:hypothetical protein
MKQTKCSAKHFDETSEDLFAERFQKVTFRDFAANTRMDIKNVDLRNQQIKRDRMIAYWKQNSLPPLTTPQKSQKRVLSAKKSP